MKNSVFIGTRKEWLESEKYLIDDIYDDKFAINFETAKIKDLIESGEDIEEPQFDLLPF